MGDVNIRSPLGAHWDPADVSWRFAIWSPAASAVTLELSGRADPATPALTVAMERDGGVWWAVVPGGVPGGADLYAFRADGPWAPADGHRFDRSKVLLDPYARRVFVPPGDHAAGRAAARVRGADTAATAPRGVLDRADRSLVAPVERLAAVGDEIVYELHVRGFTMSDGAVDPDRRGTFAGLADRLDDLVALGVTVLELLPVHAIDPGEASYWGYMPLAWLAVNDAYGAGGDGAADLAALCAGAAERGIAVWLDVVYNHTTEEDELGPTYQFRGLADGAYYVTRPDGTYVDDAGTGNILRAAHPVATEIVLASLDRLADLGVAGFRFDLASIVGRDVDGTPQSNPSSAIASRRGRWRVTCGWWARRGTSRSYQVGGAFPGRDWAQWNDRFRDDVRGFLRGEPGWCRRWCSGCRAARTCSPAHRRAASTS